MHLLGEEDKPHATELVEISEQRLGAETSAAEPNLRLAHPKAVDGVAAKTPDHFLQGSTVDGLVLHLVDEGHRERKTVELHHVQHAQVSVLPRVVQLYSRQLGARIEAAVLLAAVGAMTNLTGSIWRIVRPIGISVVGVRSTCRRLPRMVIPWRGDVEREAEPCHLAGLVRALPGVAVGQLNLEGLHTVHRRPKARPGAHSMHCGKAGAEVASRVFGKSAVANRG